MLAVRKPGRPPKMASLKKRGRPKGSKNKPKLASASKPEAPKKRGRPKGSKNKSKLPAKRGRPIGSKNKKKKLGRKPMTIWQKIHAHLSEKEWVPCSMIADKIGMHQKFVSAILTRKEQVGEVKKTRVKHEFDGYNKAFGYRLAVKKNEKSKKRA